MGGDVRAIAVALVGLTLSTPCHSQEVARGTVEAKDIKHPKPITALVSVEKPSTDPSADLGCRAGQDDRRSDLCAQWKAADAAAASARWTFWTWIVSVGGLLIGGGTLFAAWRAAHWAKAAAGHAEAGAMEAAKAAGATVMSNEIAREATRPWLKVDVGPTISFEANHGGGSNGFRVRVLAENLGTAPAVRVHYRPEIIHAPGGFSDEREVQRLIEKLIRNRLGVTVHVGDEVEINPDTLWVQRPLDAIGDFVPTLPPELPQHLLGLVVFYRHATLGTVYYVASLFEIRAALPIAARHIPLDSVVGEVHGAIRFGENGRIIHAE